MKAYHRLLSALSAALFMLLSAVALAGSWVNLNTASPSELETLPGIGPSKAQAIVDYRQRNGPFKTVDELDEVKGFGPATIDKLRPHISVSDTEPPSAQASVPAKAEAEGPKGPASPVNLNTASASELETIPGVGPSRAQLIIERRDQAGPFTDPSQIMEIKGIGPKTYENMRAYITVK